MRRVSAVATLLALSATAGFAATAAGPAAPGYSPESAPALLATGDDSNVDGYLEVTMDEYGSWGNFEGVLNDIFNPVGQSQQLVTFSDGFYLTLAEANQRQLLTTMQAWLDVGPDDGSLDHAITGNNNSADTNGDGVDDVVMSSFDVSGTGVDLSVVHRARVSSLGGGVAQITQDYEITNNGGSEITFQMTRNYDGDLLYNDGDVTNDEVGTSWNADGGDRFAFLQEVGDPATAVTISGAADAYYGGKLGILPGGVPPAYGFGTDVQVYEAFGTPTNWENHIAGIGYDADGASGAQPSGCDVGTGCDAFTGLTYDVTIAAGGTETVSIAHTYGSNTPGGGGGDLTFTVTGSCPGTTTLTATGGTPNGRLGIIFSDSEGSDPLNAGPCQGTNSGLDSPSLFTIRDTDGSGGFVLERTAPAGVCGTFLQLVDAAAGCAVSNVTQVPN